MHRLQHTDMLAHFGAHAERRRQRAKDPAAYDMAGQVSHPSRSSSANGSDLAGANDAVHAPGLQHVPLDEYKAGLQAMVERVQQADRRTRILLITPPPFLTEYWREQHIAWALREGRASSPEEALYGTNRDADTTKMYGEAVLGVAKEAGIEAVDLFAGMPEAAGGDSEDLLRPFFT